MDGRTMVILFAVAFVLCALAGLGSCGYCALWGAHDLRCVGSLR